MKKCTTCKLEKPLHEFSKDSRNKGGLKHSCRGCVREYHQRHRELNKEKITLQHRDYYRENKAEIAVRARSYKLKHLYGLSRDQYDEIVKDQNGLCKICKRAPSGKYKHLVVDHDHKTGRVRGLLCHNCNKGLGIFEDRLDLLENARLYLIETESVGIINVRAISKLELYGE